MVGWDPRFGHMERRSFALEVGLRRGIGTVWDGEIHLMTPRKGANYVRQIGRFEREQAVLTKVKIHVSFAAFWG
jgi:hypothetical protein